MFAFSRDASLGQRVTTCLARPPVFERWGLNNGCGCKRSLMDACFRKRLPVETVVRELEESDVKMMLQDLVDGSGVSSVGPD